MLRVQEKLKKESLYYVIGYRSGNIERVYDLRSYDSAYSDVEVHSTVGSVRIRCSCLKFKYLHFMLQKLKVLKRFPTMNEKGERR